MVNSAELIIYGIASVLTSLFSSVAGGGGGFIITPLLIFLGLSPAQAVANGKFMGFSLAISNVRVLRKQKLHSWSDIIPLIAISVVVGLIAARFIVKIDGEVYQKMIGVLILSMVPLVHFKKVGHSSRVVSRNRKAIGYVLTTGTLSMQAMFSSGLGTLVNLSLMSFGGMSAMEAGINRRYSQLFLNGVLIAGLWGSGLIVWSIVVVGILANLVGGTIGAHMALKKGNAYVMTTLKVLMVCSGVALLLI